MTSFSLISVAADLRRLPTTIPRRARGAGLWFAVMACSVHAAPDRSLAPDAAGIELRRLYASWNQTGIGDLYCGCTWAWTKNGAGKMQLSACGYVASTQPRAAQQLTWTPIVPLRAMGKGRECWRRGGEKACSAGDDAFQAMSSDLHNLVPAGGEVAMDRAGADFGELPSALPRYGLCPSKFDRAAGLFEPRDEVKGFVARVTFYMADRYAIRLSEQQQDLLMEWDRSFPVTPWEAEREKKLEALTGVSNLFVTGARSWVSGYVPSAEGLDEADRESALRPAEEEGVVDSWTGPVVGSRRTNIFYLPEGCTTKRRLNRRDQVDFDSPAEARAAGFELAKECQQLD